MQASRLREHCQSVSTIISATGYIRCQSSVHICENEIRLLKLF